MRSLTQQVFGQQVVVSLPAGALADETTRGQIVDVQFDWPRVWLAYLRTEGLDRIAGDVGQLEIELRMGAGLSNVSQSLLDPGGLSGAGPLMIPASTVVAVARTRGVTLAAPRILRWSVLLAPWDYSGPETQGRTPFPLNRAESGQIPSEQP